MTIYIPLKTFKEAAQYQPHEAQKLKINLYHPQGAKKVAERLRELLHPPIMVLPLTLLSSKETPPHSKQLLGFFPQ